MKNSLEDYNRGVIKSIRETCQQTGILKKNGNFLVKIQTN